MELENKISKKKVVIVTGYPGSGKSTLSKFLAKKSNFIHIEYDVQDEKLEDNILMDAIHFDTEKLLLTLQYFTHFNYEILLVYVNTDKDICRLNIKKRGRTTMDIEKLNIHYDIDYLLTKITFDYIQLDNYKITINKQLSNKLLFDRFYKIISQYENRRA